MGPVCEAPSEYGRTGLGAAACGGRSRPKALSDRSGTVRRFGIRGEGAEKKVDGGPGRHRGQEDSEPRHPDRASRRAEPARHMTAHCTGCQLCVSVCPSGVLRPSTALTTFMQPVASYELRLLPARMYEMFGSMSDGRDSENHGGRQVGHPNRSCRMGQGKLRSADGRREMRQLRPPLSDGRDRHGSFRSRYAGFARNSRRERRALHRLRSLRKPLSGTPFQRHLRRGACETPYRIICQGDFLWEHEIRK